MKITKMAPSPRQLLNEQGVRRISGFKNLIKNINVKRSGIRIGSWNIGSFCGRGTEICEELRKRNVDVCCLQEVRWRGQGARFVGVKNRRYKLWWSGNEIGLGGVGILVKEEICEKVVEIRRRSDRVMTTVLMFEEQMIRIVCAYGPQSGRNMEEKIQFYDQLACEWELGSSSEMILGLGDFNGHVGKQIDGFEGVHGGNGLGLRNVEGRLLLEFCDARELCVANTWYKKKEKNKITFRSGGNESEIDFIVVRKQERKFLKDVKVIPGELQHGLVLADVDDKKINKVIKKERLKKRKVWKLQDKEIKAKFEEKVAELISTKESELWSSFKESVLKACDEICGVTRTRKSRGNTWWWNEEVKAAVANKKKAFKKWCSNRCEENKIIYKRMKNQTKRVISNAIKVESKKEIDNLRENPNNIFKLKRLLKQEGKDVEGGRCIRGSDGRLGCTEIDRRNIWKEHFEKIMNEENDWDQRTEVDMVEGPVEKVAQAEIVRAITEMKMGKAPGLSGVNSELIAASGKIGIKVMTELCQRLFDGHGIPEEWKTSALVPIFKRKGSVMNCDRYRGVKLLDHAMKIIERVVENRLRKMVSVDTMQFGFMPGKGTMDAVFILRRLQEEYRKVDKKLYMCFVDMEKAFDRIPRKVIEWALRKKSLPERLVRTVMDLYEGSKTKVRVGNGYSEEFLVKVGVHQGSVLSPFLFAIVVDVVAEEIREGVPYEILYADDLVLVSETLEGLQRKFCNWKVALEKKGMKINVEKTKMMVSGTEGEVYESKIDPCGVCSKRVMSNSLQCLKCCKWIHGRCAKIKRVNPKAAKEFICSACKGTVKEKEQKEIMCGEVETVKSFCYLGDRMDACGGCETAVTARTRIGWMKFRECGELLNGKRLSLKMKGKIYRCCVRSAILYGSETWCLRETEMSILRRTERAMVRAMCGVKLADEKRTEELMNRLGLEESIDKLARANGLRWYGHILRKEDGEAIREALHFNIEGPRKRGRPKMMWRKQVMNDMEKVGLTKEDALDRTKWRKGVKMMAMR